MTGGGLMITVVTIRNPFDLGDRERQELPYLSGAPVANYIRTALMKASSDIQLVVSRNGAVLTEAEWQTVIPQTGDYLGVCPVVGKSENEQKTLGILAGIALTVVTMGVTNMITAKSWGAFWRSGVWNMIGGATLINVGGVLLSQMAKPEIDTSDSASIQTWGLQTLQGQGNPVPLTYGKVRTAGQVLAQHISIENDQQYLNLLLCGGEGELNFPDGIQKIKINDNSIENYGDLETEMTTDVDNGVTEKYGMGVDSNCKIAVYKRYGTNIQQAIPNFEKSYFDQYLGFELSSELNYQQWVTAETDGDNGDRLEVVLECPAGLYHIDDDGDLSEARVQVHIQFRNEDEKEWREFAHSDGIVTLKGNKYEPLRKVVTMVMPEQKKYYIQCQCVKRSGNDTTRDGTQVFWTYLSQVIDKEFTRPGKALLGIKALATDQLSGSVPTITWEQTRTKVWVCVDAAALAYEFKAADNPAWACYDLIHRAKYLKNPNSGEYQFTHRGVEAGRLDYQAFVDWAKFCDKYDLKVNIIIDSVTDLWGALAKIEVAGRGKVILRGTRYSCIFDDPEQKPVQLFNMSNIIKDSFSEEFLPMADRANAIEVTFLNANKDYEKDVLTVYNQDENVNQLNPTQIALDGVTDFKQAYREANYRLKTNKYLSRVIKFDADIDAIACQVGDVILFQHDLPEWGSGGRVVGATATTVNLDKKVVMESGKDYRIMFRYGKEDTMDYPGHAVVGGTVPADGSVVTVEIDVLTLAEPLATVPQESDLYAFGEVDRVAKPFRVTRISRSKDFRRSITALEYIKEVYEEGQPPEVLNYSVRDNAVANLKGAAYRDFEGKVWLNLSWKPLANYGGAGIRIGETAGGNKLQVGKVGYDQSYFAYQVTPGKTYYIDVVAVDQFGNAMTPESLTYQAPLKAAPPDVQNPELQEDTYIKKDGTVVTNLELTFAKSSQLKTYFEIYYSTDGRQSWKYDGYTTDRSYWLKNLPNNGTVWVKVVTVDQTDTALKSGGVVAGLALTGKSAPPSDVAVLNVVQRETDRAELILTWEAVNPELNPDLKGYEVRVGAGWENGTAISGLVYGLSTTFKATASANYDFWVKAVDNSGNYSENAATTSLYVEVKPNAPANGSVVQDTYDKSNLIVSWAGIADKDLAYYEVRLGSNWDAGVLVATTKETGVQYQVSASGIYYFMICAVNVAGFRSAILNLAINVSVEPANVSRLAVRQSDTDRRLIKFTWTGVADKDFVYYEIRKGTLWSEAAVVASRIGNPYYDYVASAEETATFLVKAVSKAGFASNDPAAATVAIFLTPSRPGTGSITSDSGNRLKLMISWDKVSDLDLDCYEVKYGDAVIAKTGETTLNYTVAAGGAHQFTVRAKNKANFYSATLTLNTVIRAEPAAVSEFTVAQSPLDRRILQFAWSAVTDSDLSHYEIRKGANWDSAAVWATGLQTTTLEKMATAAETATFLIKAITRGGAGSADATGKTIAIALKPNRPGSGSIAASPANKADLVIAWEPVADTDLVNYEVRRGTSWDTGTALGSTRENSFTYSAAVSGSLNFMVCAKNIGGYYSSPLFLATVANTEPLDVTGFTAAQWANDHSKVRLTWDAVPEADIDYYEIREGISWDDVEVHLIAKRITDIYYDVTIAEERLYRFWIVAVNKSGKSSLNPTMLKNSFNMNPSTPTGLTVVTDPNDKSVLQISWQAVVDQDLQDYGLKVGDKWDIGEEITWTKELKTTWRPPESKEYKFILRARNNSGYESGDVITTYEAYIEPADVTGFKAFQNGATIAMVWDKSPESDVVFYEIREGSTFDNSATLVVTGLTETNYQVKVDTETTRRYHVKAINRTGNYSQNVASKSVTVTNLPPKNVIYSYDELTLKNGTHQNTVFGSSSYNFATFGGKFSDYPETRFADVGGLTVLKLKKAAQFRRSSVAYLSDGIAVEADTPRCADLITDTVVKEGTVNLLATWTGSFSDCGFEDAGLYTSGPDWKVSIVSDAEAQNGICLEIEALTDKTTWDTALTLTSGISVAPSAVYTFSMRFKVINCVSNPEGTHALGKLGMWSHWHTPSNFISSDYVFWQVSQGSTSNGWQVYTATMTSTDNSTGKHFYLGTGSVKAGTKYRVDWVQFEQKDHATDFVNGQRDTVYKVLPYGQAVLVEEAATTAPSNSLFGSGVADWVLSCSTGCAATKTAVSGGNYGGIIARIAVTESTVTKNSNFQFYKTIGTPSVGQTIACQARVRSNISFLASFSCHLHESPWTGFGSKWVTLTPEWQTIEFAATVTESLETRVNLSLGFAPAGAVIEVDYIIAEVGKAYCTSPHDGMRQAECLTLPTTGLSVSEGTIEGIVEITDVAKRRDGTTWPQLIHVLSASNGRGLSVAHSNCNAEWVLDIFDDNGNQKAVVFNDMNNGWYYYKIYWTALITKIEFWDLAVKTKITSASIAGGLTFSQFAPALMLGSWNTAYYINTRFGKHRLSNVARTEDPDFDNLMATDENTIALMEVNDGINSYYRDGSYLCQRKDMGSVINANIGSRFVSSVLLSSGVFAKLQYRISTDGTSWTEWIDFVPAQATFRYVDFRVILSTADMAKTPEVNILAATIDVPDVDKYGSAIVAAGGTDIPFGHTYWQVPVVTPTAIGPGLRAELASVSQDRFKVRVLDSSGTDVGGSINWIAKGF
jgi:predicted phage tail protein